MIPVVNGLPVLSQHAIAALIFGGCMLCGAAIMRGFLHGAGDHALDGADTVALLSAAWIVPAIIISVFAAGVTILLRIPLAVSVIAGFLATLWLAKPWRHWRAPGALSSVAAASALFLFMFALGLSRLAVLKSITLPPYFDSASHYDLIQQLLRRLTHLGQAAPLALPVSGYYHLGYHIFLAVLASVADLDVAGLMLVSGQLALAVLSFPLYILVHRTTGSRLAGLLAVVLGSLGWYMPAYAVNWGKYPALFSMLALLTALDLAYLARASGLDEISSHTLAVLALLSACAAVIIHTRALLILALVLIAWIVSGRWLTQTSIRRSLLLAVVLAALAGLIAALARDQLLGQVLDPYLSAGAGLTALTAVMCVFALRSFPRLAVACLLVILFLLSGLLIPAPVPLVGTLLDRPLVEMILFAPLSVLFATGVAGLASAFRPLGRQPERAVVALLSIGIVWNAAGSYNFNTSPCCAAVASDDLVALTWLRQNASPTSRVAIASAALRVAPGEEGLLDAPADAGAWIHPLAATSTILLPFTTEFGDPLTHRLLCDSRAEYVYVGHAPQSFSAASLEANRGWYEARLRLPAVSIFALTACGP